MAKKIETRMKMNLYNSPGRIWLVLMSFLCLACSSKSTLEWEQLFNGKDLDNWQIKIKGYELHDNFGETFRVEDGILQVRYDQYKDGFNERYGHIFYEKPFSSYLIGVEYRFVGDQIKNNPGDWALRNNGIMLHGQDPETMGLDQDFPNSIEVQLLGGNGKEERSTANICTPGTQYVLDEEIVKEHCSNSSSKTFHGDQWVRVEVLVLKDSLIVHFVNGEEVMRYSGPQTDDGSLLKGGTISLQSESHPTDFRKVEIVNLEKYYKNPTDLRAVISSLLSEKRYTKE